MNPRSLHVRQSRAGLSIPEWLFILLLIVVLASFCPCSCTPMRENARRTIAKNVAQNIQNAVKAYATDYGKFPAIADPRSSNEKFVVIGDANAGATQSNAGLFDVLRSIPRGVNANNALNIRQQKYIEDKSATKAPIREGFVDGPEFPPDIQGQLIDPWGTQYCIVIETDDDSRLNLGSIYSDLTADIRFSVVAFSLGKNGKLGGKDNPGRYKKPSSSEAPEDIVSWQ